MDKSNVHYELFTPAGEVCLRHAKTALKTKFDPQAVSVVTEKADARP